MPEANEPTPEQIAAAQKAYADASDKVAVLRDFPFLVPILNSQLSTLN